MPPEPETPEDTGGRSWVAPGIAFGIGGALLLVGAINRRRVVGRANELKDRCPDNHCAPRTRTRETP